MRLHPQVRALPDAVGPIDPNRLADQRRSVAKSTPAEAGRGPSLHEVHDLDVGAVPCRLYRPRAGRLPVIVYLHGGGWVDGGLASHDPLCRWLADESGMAVLAVDYRLAPEHPHPAASEDVDRVLCALPNLADPHDLDADRIALAGDSAGGQLAAVAARRCTDSGRNARAQVLFYPVTDPEGALWGDRVNPGLKADNMRWCWKVYAPDASTRETPAVSPLIGPHDGLPPTLVVTAEYDILANEGEAYAEALAEAGVSVVTFQARGQVHGFVRRLKRFDAAAVAVDLAAGFLRRHLRA